MLGLVTNFVHLWNKRVVLIVVVELRLLVNYLFLHLVALLGCALGEDERVCALRDMCAPFAIHAL